jgi:NhaA family Na+:H+ antiporter
MKIKEGLYLTNIQNYLTRFKSINPNEKVPTLTNEQLHILEEVKKDTNEITPPLQRLEHAMHPFVTFLIIPIFALANAGVSLAVDLDQLFSTNVTLGVLFGLTVGKVVGIVGFTMLFVKLKIAPFPVGMNIRNLFGLALLAGIGFTMSLFVTSLAFTDEEFIAQAKIGILAASVIAGILGYIVLNTSQKKVISVQ